MKTSITTVLVSLLGATGAAAHPGHGAGGHGDSVLHYLTEPLHLGAGLLVVLGALGLIALRRRQANQR